MVASVGGVLALDVWLCAATWLRYEMWYSLATIFVAPFVGVFLGLRLSRVIDDPEVDRLKHRAAFAAVLALAAVALFGLVRIPYELHGPDDEKLIALYNRLRPSLDRVEALVQRTYPGASPRSKPHTVRFRVDDIAALVSNLGMEDDSRYPTGFEVEVWGHHGLYGDADSRGFAYLAQPPAKEVPNVAAYVGGTYDWSGWKVYRPLGGHWYLYCETKTSAHTAGQFF